MSQRRRKFLHALGLTAAGSLAGCTGSLPLGGSDGSSGDSAAVPGRLDTLSLPASTAWFQYEDLQATENSDLRSKITGLFQTDESNLDGLVRVLQGDSAGLATIMISGSFDADNVANSVYNNFVQPQIDKRSELSEDDVTKTTKRGFNLLSNDQLGRFAINDEVVLVQNGASATGDVSFDLEPFFELYDGDAATLFDGASKTPALLSAMELQSSSSWIDLTSELMNSGFIRGATNVNLDKLSAIGATEMIRTGQNSSTTFAAHFESTPTESKLSQIEEASVFSHVKTEGNVAVFEADGGSVEGQDL